MSNEEFSSGYYETEFESVDAEIARMALLCGVPLLDPGVITEVIKGNDAVCTTENPIAFRKLRGLLEIHYQLTSESVDAVGAAESTRILEEVLSRLTRHFATGNDT